MLIPFIDDFLGKNTSGEGKKKVGLSKIGLTIPKPKKHTQGQKSLT